MSDEKVSKQELSKEERVLRAVKTAVTGVIRDTATKPGLVHPLSEQTIEDLRQCLALISARERELAQLHGRDQAMRPRFVDEPTKQDNTVVHFHPPKRGNDKNEG